MKIVRTLPFVFALTLAAAPGFGAGERMVAGNWTFEMETKGQDPRTFTRCITAEEAGSVNGDAATARAYAEKSAGTSCTMKDFAIDGDTVSYQVICGDTAITSKVAYHGDGFEGVLTTKSGSYEATTQLKGHRAGACP